MVLVFIQFKNTVDLTWKRESPCKHQPAILPGMHQSCKVLGTHHYSAGNIYCSSCSALCRNRKKLLWRPQSAQTCLLSQKNGLVRKCWLLGTKYSRRRVPEQYQHTKLLCNYLIFSSTYDVFLFPVRKYIT